MNPDYDFQTSDMVEISVLLYFGFEPMTVKTDEADSRRKWFIFEQTKELEAVLNRLSQGKLLIEPVRFFGAHKILKQKLKYHAIL